MTSLTFYKLSKAFVHYIYVSFFQEIKESSDDELAGQRRRRQNCLADAKRRRTCEGATTVVAKLLDEDSADKAKNGSDSNLRGKYTFC